MKIDSHPLSEGEAGMLLQAIDNMTDGLIVLDADDRFVLCNQRYRQFYPEVADMFVQGTPLDEITDVYAQRTSQLLQRDAASFSRQRNEAWRAGTPMEEVTPAGLWIETRDYRTDAGYWIGIRIDATHRRRAELEIRELNDSLERRVAERSRELADAHEVLLRKERLAVLGELTGTVAHELRNPLGTIASTIALFENQVAGHDLGLDTALARVKRSILRCDSIIEELLTFARTNTGDPQITRLDAWISETLTALDLPDHVSLSRRLDAGGAQVRIDRERIWRVLANAINNAVDALTESVPDAGPEICVSTRIEGERAYLLIEDNGPGIPDAIMNKVLDPLFSTKSFGFGLGLPFVVRVIEEHGGGIVIANGDVRGTRIELWLPITSA